VHAHVAAVVAGDQLALAAVDLFTDPEILRQAAAELRRRRGAVEYQSLMQLGQKPPLNYRMPSK
ncbi:MAG: amidohydrolase, partial [Fuerstiella sp.]|nr:amidohydrolase [Fuerstiella sp.]